MTKFSIKISISNQKFNEFIDFERKIPLNSRLVREDFFNSFCEMQYQGITDKELEQTLTVGFDNTLDVLRGLNRELIIEIDENYLNSSVEIFRKYLHNSLTRLNQVLRFFQLIEHLGRFDLEEYFNHDKFKSFSKTESAKCMALATFYVRLDCYHDCYKNCQINFLKKELELKDFELSLIAAADVKASGNSIINTTFDANEVDSPSLKDLEAYEIALKHWYLEKYLPRSERSPYESLQGKAIVEKYGRKRVETFINELRKDGLRINRKGLKSQLETVKESLSNYPDIQKAIINDIDKIR